MAAPNFRTVAMQKAQQYGIPPDLFIGLVQQESGFNPRARSPVGAQGLTQLMPATARGLGVNPLDPVQALDGGARYLAAQYKKFGAWDKALAAYNAGPGAVAKYGGIPPYKETQNYVRKIMAQMGAYAPQAAPGAAVAPPQGSASTIDPGTADARRVLLANQEALGSGLRNFLNAPVTGGKQARSPLAAVNEQLAGIMPRIVQGAASAGGSGGAAAAGAMVGASGVAAGPSAAISRAQNFIGTPYSWGGGTPSGPTKGFGRGANTVGFDCSSLVQAAWAAAGVRIPRTTFEQIKVGKPVAGLAQARPGDLIFPHSGHVQMYLGNGRVIEAPFTGGKVRIVPVGKVMAIRRPGG